MEKKVAALAFRKTIRNTGKTQENMTPALRSSSPESFALSVPTAAPVAISPNRLRSPDQSLNPLENKAFLATLRVLKRNVAAFFLRTGEFSPKLEGRPIFPTRFNALI
jgi:hypothetical protein